MLDKSKENAYNKDNKTKERNKNKEDSPMKT